MKCDICGKFRNYNDLNHHFIPDSEISIEENWFECKFCEEKENNAKVLKESAE